MCFRKVSTECSLHAHHPIVNPVTDSWGRIIMRSLPVVGVFTNLNLCYNTPLHAKERVVHHVKYLGISLLTTTAFLMLLNFNKAMQGLIGENFLVGGIVSTSLVGFTLLGFANGAEPRQEPIRS